MGYAKHIRRCSQCNKCAVDAVIEVTNNILTFKIEKCKKCGYENTINDVFNSFKEKE